MTSGLARGSAERSVLGAAGLSAKMDGVFSVVDRQRDIVERGSPRLALQIVERLCNALDDVGPAGLAERHAIYAAQRDEWPRSITECAMPSRSRATANICSDTGA